jgi:hypothetical protein
VGPEVPAATLRPFQAWSVKWLFQKNDERLAISASR